MNPDLPSSPAPAADDTDRPLPRLRGPGGRTLRVLLADDNAVNREVGVALLEELGLQVDTAADGRAAVDRVAATTYDLVLMDMQMPHLDGLAATRVIRTTAAGARLPVVAMTANAFDETRAACLSAGMDDFVSKPVDLWELAATLARWLPR